MATEDPIERAYGLLWLMPTGNAMVDEARQELLKLLDREGKRRGVQYAMSRKAAMETGTPCPA